MRVLTLPNAVTLLRFPLAGAFLLADGTAARAGIIGAAGASDWLDGWLSRRLDQRSELGELADPAADRTFLLVVLATFWREGRLGGGELALLLSRDAFTLTGFGLARALRLPLRFRSRPSGKVVTALQLTTAGALLLAPRLGRPLVWATGAAGVLAVADYAREGWRGLRRRSAAP